MGYTVLPKPPVNKPVTVYQEPIEPLPPQPLPTPERPVEAFGKPEEGIPGESLTCYITDACSAGYMMICVAQVKTSLTRTVECLEYW